jgi:hypothetical protein
LGSSDVGWFFKGWYPVLPDRKVFDEASSQESAEATFERIASAHPSNIGFTVHAVENGETLETHRTSPTVTVARARGLSKSGWRVHIADSTGRQYAPLEFDEILKFDR